MRSRFSMTPAVEFPRDGAVQQFVDRQLAFVKDIMSVPLTHLPDDGPKLTSKGVRKAPSALASWLLDLVKRALRSQGVQVAIALGGCVRANADYEKKQASHLLRRSSVVPLPLPLSCDQPLVALPLGAVRPIRAQVARHATARVHLTSF